MTTSPLFDRAVSKLCSILESYDLTDRADKIRRAGDADALLRAIDRAGDVANDRAGVCGKQALLLLSWSEQDLARMAEKASREEL